MTYIYTRDIYTTFYSCRHVQFSNGHAADHLGMQDLHNQSVTGQRVNAAAYGGVASAGYSHGMTSSAAATGSRYNLYNAAPLSPVAASFHGSMLPAQTGPPSVYHGVSYGSRRGSMQSLVAASGMCLSVLTLLPFPVTCLRSGVC